MKYHVLNGDALLDRFMRSDIEGEVVICREMLIDGPAKAPDFEKFWQLRKDFLGETMMVSKEEYTSRIIDEFERLKAIEKKDEVNLWFGYDLYCQANMWFAVYYLSHCPSKEISIVYPSYLKNDKIYEDFGNATVNDLMFCYANRVKLKDTDLTFILSLWNAYSKQDLIRLELLSQNHFDPIPNLNELLLAHKNRFLYYEGMNKPERILYSIILDLKAARKAYTFDKVFPLFFIQGGIYGWGDDQVRKMYDKTVAMLT